MVAIEEERKREQLKKNLKKQLQSKNKDIDFMDSESFGRILRGKGVETAIELAGDCIPVFGETLKIIATNLYRALQKK